VQPILPQQRQQQQQEEEDPEDLPSWCGASEVGYSGFKSGIVGQSCLTDVTVTAAVLSGSRTSNLASVAVAVGLQLWSGLLTVGQRHTACDQRSSRMVD
jgi:hypothetical protein